MSLAVLFHLVVPRREEKGERDKGKRREDVGERGIEEDRGERIEEDRGERRK